MRFLIILLTLLPLLEAQEQASTEIRTRPISFIHDPTNSLTRNAKDSLEIFLREQSNNYNSEVFLLLEPQEKGTPEETKESFQKLGASWSAMNWVIISHDPLRDGIPKIVTGGPFLEKIDLQNWDQELERLISLSLQAWSNEPEIDFLTRKVAESVTFHSRSQDAMVMQLVRHQKTTDQKAQHSLKSKKILYSAIAAAALITLLLGGILFYKFYVNRRKMIFPETKWKTHLGAPHSGGSDLEHHF